MSFNRDRGLTSGLEYKAAIEKMHQRAADERRQASMLPDQVTYDGPGTVEDYLANRSQKKLSTATSNANSQSVSGLRRPSPSGQSSNTGLAAVAGALSSGNQKAPTQGYRHPAPSTSTPAQNATSTSTAQHLDGILKNNSPLMQRAATQGQQFANQRGLLNSSMAGQAAQGAMIDRATPIAQQDAQFGQNLAINQQQYGFNSALSDQQYRQNLGLNEQGFNFDMGRMQQQFGFSSQLATQEAQQSLSQLFATSSANGWGVMANNLTDIIGQYSGQLERIQMNPDIAEEDKAELIEQVLAMRDADIKFQQSLYNELPNYLANTNVFPTVSENSSSRISNLYVSILGRQPDDEGLAYYTQRVNSGEMTMKDVEWVLEQHRNQ